MIMIVIIIIVVVITEGLLQMIAAHRPSLFKTPGCKAYELILGRVFSVARCLQRSADFQAESSFAGTDTLSLIVFQCPRGLLRVIKESKVQLPMNDSLYMSKAGPVTQRVSGVELTGSHHET